MNTAHTITHITRTGANEVLRLIGAPDCDSAAMLVAAKFAGTVKTVVAIDADAGRVWGEIDAGEWAA